MPAVKGRTRRFKRFAVNTARTSVGSYFVAAEPFQEVDWSLDPESPTRQKALERAQRKASLLATLFRIRVVQDRKEGWNDYDALPPNRDAIVYAKSWLRALFQELEEANLIWLQPHVTSSAEGEIVLQWWNDPKRLTIYFSAHEATFIKSWGPDIETEMEDGDAASATSRARLWEWLTS
jgi:hypothetical protein